MPLALCCLCYSPFIFYRRLLFSYQCAVFKTLSFYLFIFLSVAYWSLTPLYSLPFYSTVYLFLLDALVAVYIGAQDAQIKLSVFDLSVTEPPVPDNSITCTSQMQSFSLSICFPCTISQDFRTLSSEPGSPSVSALGGQCSDSARRFCKMVPDLTPGMLFLLSAGLLISLTVMRNSSGDDAHRVGRLSLLSLPHGRALER